MAARASGGADDAMRPTWPAPAPAPPDPAARARATPPLAILVDYDGTIALTDVSDTVMAEYVTGAWEAEAAAYDAGLMGSRRLMTLEMALVDADPADLLATAAAQPHDPGFVPFVRRAQAAGIPIEVVSDGFGFFIEPALAALGVGGAAGRHRPDDVRRPAAPPSPSRTATRRASCAAPASATGCSPTRRPAAPSSSSATARATATPRATATSCSRSARSCGICLEAGWPFQRWTEFSEIDAWLADTLAAWQADPATLPGRPATPPVFCGPEVWGEGLVDPPPDVLAADALIR